MTGNLPSTTRVKVRQGTGVNVWPSVLAATAVVLVAVGLVVAGAVKADAAVWPSQTPEPYGGCAEAVQVLDHGIGTQSAGVRYCRRHGWLVNRYAVVNPSGHAWTTLPACQSEDDNRPCYWDARRRGNHAGHGLIAWPGRVVYVDYVNGRRVTTGPLQHAWYLAPDAVR